MKRTIALLFVGLLCGMGLSQQVFGQAKPNIGLGTVNIEDSDSELGLIWHTIIVPGEEVLLLKKTYKQYEETFFLRYRLVGVVGNSLKIEQTGASQPKGATSAQTSSSFEKAFYVEQAPDGVFYFVPEDVKGLGSFKIRRDEKEPGKYLVAFDRRAT